ncbi:acyl-CoA synthetase [Nocardioides sp. zg-536]|uniref:Acyl-CoA synthetase n=1 Tax=Nocardioides faecalis TaxID=2803858 RepID=A0A938XYQ1_9ACTN|nr:acyl-CoA synthetase [Nocardioides faecalis]MBM9458927.1 acyl-CoA synthetase [Nocardioides faecalis]MBS4753977.1 acyl-CoA synthetase [Nocardioides faecalis]QVI60327.1 acyl-CoA synthetase [Nocardioides faecalis]
MALNIADLFEHAVDAVPEKPAVQVGDRVITFAELEAEANKLAHHLQSQGIGKGDHVGLYAKNSIEHVIALIAILKVRAVSINVNFRYVAGELEYLFDNADLVGLVHDRVYAPLVAEVAPKVPGLKTFVAVPNPLEPEDASDLSSFGGVTLEEAVEGQSDARDFGERSPDDVHIIYTGGTTGFPKGVMWRHEDFWRVLGGGIDFMTGEPLEEYDQSKKAKDGSLVTLPLSPLMHGGAQASLLMHLFAGQVTILEPKFDPVRTWELVDKHGVQMLFMTGDAMAIPLIDAYEAGGFDGQTLFAIASSAAIFSKSVKERWMKAFPNAVFTDSIGSSETGFQGTGLQDASALSTDGPVVSIPATTVVLGDDNRPLDLVKDVGRIGRTARAGHVPIGYYKDPAKSAKTFIEVDGVRYSIPGDNARIEEGNRITLLGRGSNCINTGGEKVYPEEVEQAIKAHPGVYDVLVVGLPDPKYGQAVTAVVEPRPGEQVELEELRTFLRAHLSGYKLPRALTIVPEIPRNATGKAQYPKAKELALAEHVTLPTDAGANA